MATKYFFLHPANLHQYETLEDELAAVYLTAGAAAAGIFIPSDAPEPLTIIPRYRALPYGMELEAQAHSMGHTLINTYREHRNIADASQWWYDLHEAGLTPPRYTMDDIPHLPEGEWFVKGETNSIKNRWFDCCYAPTTADLPRVVRNNLLDTYVGNQTIHIQPYQHYRILGEAVDGRPVFNERRVFILNGDVLSQGDYWTSFPEFLKPALNEPRFTAALTKAIELTKHLASFYVIDLAERPDGTWTVVELNDGAMSGLSGNSSHEVFGKLFI